MRSERRSREGKRESKGKGTEFATVQFSTTEFLGRRDPDRIQSFRHGEPANMLRFAKGDRPKGLLVIPVIHDSVLFVKQGILNMRVSARLSTRKRLGGEGANQRNEIILWWSPKHGITPKHRIKSLRSKSLRRETFCTVSAIPAKINL